MPNLTWTSTHIVCGCPMTAMPRTPTLCSGRPRDIVGLQTIYADGHTKSLMGAHGYRWKATRLMWVPTRIYAPPQPVLGDHYRGEPRNICGRPRRFVSDHAMYWESTRCYGRPCDMLWVATYIIGCPHTCCGRSGNVHGCQRPGYWEPITH